MTIRVATIADLTHLLQIEMHFFSESRPEMLSSDFEALQLANRTFFEAHLNSPLSRTWVAEVDQEIVAAGTLALFIRPGFSGRPPAIEAYIHNMYTLPEHRRRGFAREILAAARSYAESQGITKIWLHATEAGRPLYEAAGFQIAAA